MLRVEAGEVWRGQSAAESVVRADSPEGCVKQLLSFT